MQKCKKEKFSSKNKVFSILFSNKKQFLIQNERKIKQKKIFLPRKQSKHDERFCSSNEYL